MSYGQKRMSIYRIIVFWAPFWSITWININTFQWYWVQSIITTKLHNLCIFHLKMWFSWPKNLQKWQNGHISKWAFLKIGVTFFWNISTGVRFCAYAMIFHTSYRRGSFKKLWKWNFDAGPKFSKICSLKIAENV